MTYLGQDDSLTSNVDNPDDILFTSAKRWGFKRRSLYHVIKTIVPRFFSQLFNLEVNGAEYLRKFPEGSPVIFCGNHRSHLDALIIGSAIAHPKFGWRNYAAFMVNGNSMNENWIFRQTKYFGGFPVFRENPEPSLRYAIETLKAGLALIIFPQGGRVSHSSPLSEFHKMTTEGKTGVGRIILRLNGKVPVVPFYIHGSAEALGIGSFSPRWGSSLSITFGDPIYFFNYSRKSEWNQESDEFYINAREIANAIMHRIWELLRAVEADFLSFLEQKMKTQIDTYFIENNKLKINKVLRKISKISSQDIKKFLYKDE